MRRPATSLLAAAALVTAACAGPPTAEQCANRLEIELTYPVIDQSMGSVAVVRGDEAALQLVSVATADGDTQPVAGLESSDFSLSPDRTRFVVSDGQDLAIVDVAAGERTPLGVAGTRPAWSPDGTRIAYIGADTALWVVEADGSNPVSLQAAGSTGSPAWSLDGAQLAFSFDVEPRALGYEAIHVMDATGADDRRVARGVTFDQPSWSPDGTRIAFHDFDGVNVMCADGALAFEIVPDALFPVWSPDGNQIVFTSTSSERGGPGLFIIEAGGGIPVRLTDDASDIPESWSADPWP